MPTRHFANPEPLKNETVKEVSLYYELPFLEKETEFDMTSL